MGDAELVPVFPRELAQTGAHLGEEFDMTVADFPDEAQFATQVQNSGFTISEATVPDCVIDALEADLAPPVPSTVPACAGMLLQLGLPCVGLLSETGPTQWESGAEFSLETRPPEFNSESEEGLVSREGRVFSPMGPVDGPVPLTFPASSGGSSTIDVGGCTVSKQARCVGAAIRLAGERCFGCGVQPG